MATIKQIRDKQNEDIDDILEANEETFNAKAIITNKVLGVIMEKFIEGFDETLELETKKEYYDKELCNTLKEMVSNLVSSLSKLKPPTVTVNPNISMDLQPLQSIASDISKGQNNLISLIDKFNEGDKSGELYRLITAMIGRQNIFLEKGFQQFDYTNQLKSISDGLKPVGYKGIVTLRNGNGFISEFEINPK